MSTAKKCDTFSICACHPCAGAMLIFSVSFQFWRMTGCDPGSDPTASRIITPHTPPHAPHKHTTPTPTPTPTLPHHTLTQYAPVPPSRTAVPDGRNSQHATNPTHTLSHSPFILQYLSASHPIPSHSTITPTTNQCRATITPHIQNVTKVGAMLQSASLSQ